MWLLFLKAYNFGSVALPASKAGGYWAIKCMQQWQIISAVLGYDFVKGSARSIT